MRFKRLLLTITFSLNLLLSWVFLSASMWKSVSMKANSVGAASPKVLQQILRNIPKLIAILRFQPH